MGLSEIAYRFLGKHMRKKDKEIKTGSTLELTNELQLEYVSLDALVPLILYRKFF